MRFVGSTVEWDEIEKLLSPPLRFLEFVAALSPTPMYRIAKSFERLGLTASYRAVLTDYERLGRRGIYVTYDCGSSKCIQVNIDLVCTEFGRKMGLSDEEGKVLCDSIKEFVSNMRFEPQEVSKNLKRIVREFGFYFFMAYLSTEALTHYNRVDEKVKEGIVLKMATEIGRRVLEKPGLALRLLNSIKLIAKEKPHLAVNPLLVKCLVNVLSSLQSKTTDPQLT
jgi:hypothetical protein